MKGKRLIKLADITCKCMIECLEKKLEKDKQIELLQEMMRGLSVTNEEFTEVLEFLKFCIKKEYPRWRRWQTRKRKIESKPSVN